MSARPLDAISLGIMWDRLVAITDEIVSALVRTSFSTIVARATTSRRCCSTPMDG